MMSKEYVAKAIEITGALFGLVIGYQAVRFCQGVIGAPILDQAIEYIGRPFALALDQQLDARLFSPMLDPYTNAQHLFASFAGWIQKGVYYLLGIFVWLELGLFLQSCARCRAHLHGRFQSILRRSQSGASRGGARTSDLRSSGAPTRAPAQAT